MSLSVMSGNIACSDAKWRANSSSASLLSTSTRRSEAACAAAMSSSSSFSLAQPAAPMMFASAWNC